jgi:hypothetical protein
MKQAPDRHEEANFFSTQAVTTGHVDQAQRYQRVTAIGGWLFSCRLKEERRCVMPEASMPFWPGRLSP